MSIEWRILGKPGEDNATFLEIDSGQSLHSILVDCGEGVLDGLRISRIQSVEHLCFSHLHMDHVCGFDTFFRHNYNRPGPPVAVWGPEATTGLLHHRFQSFVWNLHHEQPGEWVVREVLAERRPGAERIEGARFRAAEAFEVVHPLPTRPVENKVVFHSPAYDIEALSLPHHTTLSMGYRFREASRLNVDPGELQRSGLTPGPWLQALTDATRGDTEVLSLGSSEQTIAELRDSLLIETPGESLACLTDFRVEPDTPEWSRLVEWLSSTDTLICECQYRASDDPLARKNGHMTTHLVGALARDAGVGRLVLQHLSRRYDREEWIEMLRETRSRFASTSFPPEWGIHERNS